jgi:hypothetical protein
VLTPDGEQALVHVGDAGAIVADDVLVHSPFTDAESRPRGPIIAPLAPNLVLHGGFRAVSVRCSTSDRLHRARDFRFA